MAEVNSFAPLVDMFMENVDASSEGGSDVTSPAGDDVSMRKPPPFLPSENELISLQRLHGLCDYDHKGSIEARVYR